MLHPRTPRSDAKHLEINYISGLLSDKCYYICAWGYRKNQPLAPLGVVAPRRNYYLVTLWTPFDSNKKFWYRKSITYYCPEDGVSGVLADTIIRDSKHNFLKFDLLFFLFKIIHIHIHKTKMIIVPPFGLAQISQRSQKLK